MMTLQPGQTSPMFREFNRAPTLEELQQAVGGDLEHVRGFSSIGDDGAPIRRCVAFCNENGKRERLPLNEAATLAWERALARNGMALRNEGGFLAYLLGPVIVLYGDREFMESL